MHGSREISLASSLHRASTDALIIVSPHCVVNIGNNGKVALFSMGLITFCALLLLLGH